MFDVCIRKSARCRSSAGRGSNGNVSEIMLIMLTSSDVGTRYHLRGSKPISSLTFISSNSGLGPRPSWDTFDVPVRAEGCGVPDREGWVEPGPLLGDRASRAEGGADWGLVLICKGGRGDFPFACGGRISSRLTGIPSEIRCCCRIRDRVQFGNLVGGGE